MVMYLSDVTFPVLSMDLGRPGENDERQCFSDP